MGLTSGEAEDITDEELARRLQEEDDRAAYAALYGPPEAYGKTHLSIWALPVSL